MNWQLPCGFSKTAKLAQSAKTEEKAAPIQTRKHKIQGEVAVIETDPFGFITSWSINSEKIYGYCAAEITGKHIASLYSVKDLAQGKPVAEFRAAEDRQNPYFSFGWQRRKSGQEFWTYSESQVIRNEFNEVLGFRKYVIETASFMND